MINQPNASKPLPDKPQMSKAKLQHKSPKALGFKVAILVMLRGGLLALQMGFQLCLARFFGAETLGSFQLFTSYSATLGEFGLLGIPANNMRQIAQADTQTNRHQIARYIVKGALAVLCFASLLSLAVISLSLGLDLALLGFIKPFALALCTAVIAYCLMRCFAECLKAMEHQKLAMLIEVGLVPLVMLIAIAVIVTTGIKHPSALIWTYATVYGAAAILTIALVFGVLQRKFRSGQKSFQGDIWLDWKPLWISGLLGIIYGQFGILVLPFFSDIETVGIASAAFRYITLTTTLLMVIASLFAPKFSKAHQDSKQLKTLLAQTQIISILMFLPFGIVFMLFPNLLLGLFGEEFVAAKSMLQILCLGQFINAATGIPGVLLKMAGFANYEQNSLAGCLIIAFLALPFIGVGFGAVGVMALFAGLVALKNIVSYALAIKVIRQLNKPLV